MNNSDPLTLADVESLANVREPGCVSIYLPASPLPKNFDLARIEAKDRLRNAANTLRARDLNAVADSLQERQADLDEHNEFWRSQGHGLALFTNGSMFTTYRLAQPVAASTAVADRFHLLPLMRTLTFPGAVHVLALSQNSVRLIEIGHDRSVDTVDVAGLPENLDSVTRLDLTNDRATLAHLRVSEDPETRLREYCAAIDKSVQAYLDGSDWPLIIAATEPLASLYRAASTNRNLAEQAVPGSPDETTNDALAVAAAHLLDELNAARLSALAVEFDEATSAGLTTVNLGEIARSATMGAVRTLFVDSDAHPAGQMDDADGSLEIFDSGEGAEGADASGYCVIDEMARRALHFGARIVAVDGADIPGADVSGAGQAAAILRFAI